MNSQSKLILTSLHFINKQINIQGYSESNERFDLCRYVPLLLRCYIVDPPSLALQSNTIFESLLDRLLCIYLTVFMIPPSDIPIRPYAELSYFKMKIKSPSLSFTDVNSNVMSKASVQIFTSGGSVFGSTGYW